MPRHWSGTAGRWGTCSNRRVTAGWGLSKGADEAPLLFGVLSAACPDGCHGEISTSLTALF